MSKSVLLLSAIFFSLFVPPAFGATAYERDCAAVAKKKSSAHDRLQRLFEIEWKYEMTESPESATSTGYPGQNDRWTDLSLPAINRRKTELDAPLNALRAIPREKLSESDRLNYDVFRYELEQRLAGRRFRSEYLVITQLSGVQADVPQTLAISPTATAKDYEDMLARLRAVPKLIEQHIALMKEGLKAGVTPPKITLRDVPGQIESQLVPDPEKNSLLVPFRKFPSSIPADKRDALKRQAASILSAQVIPAYRKLLEFFTSTYLPGCVDSISMNALPDGKAWYAFNAERNTTTKLTPEQIHEIGMSEVKRLRKEMDAVIESIHFKGTFAEFSKFLRTDPQFFYNDPAELLRGYRDIAKRIDPGLIRLFGKLPRLTYGVLPIPAYSEKSAPTAYYEPGSARVGRAGYFFANTYALNTRPKWEMQSLTLHEAVPGHHLQISLAEEMENVPEFRKYLGYNAFVEGWGLYSEGLGAELGMFEDPYSHFGQLTYETWRAVRLVVDTGMHAMGWTRQQAIDFFRENTAKSDHDIEVEVDRYIVWPGQALAYKIGQMKMKSLREEAKKELGERFNIRDFHDALLRNGALPLDVLDRQMRKWMAEKATAKPAARAVAS